MTKYFAEFFGSFMLVLVGAGSIALALPHFWISIAFGTVVSLMILLLGKTSGAHINPAVSLGFYIVERSKLYLNYMVFQLLGGLAAGLIILLLLPDNPTYGETLPAVSVLSAFVIEAFITFFLMLAILIIVRTNNLKVISIVVGFIVFLAAYYAGPYTGASMNPARSFGPNIISGNSAILWLYFLAPAIGASLAALLNNFILKATK